eukprot:SAG11_NODE_1532_length_4732_cov_4.721563_3_plen_44_part_00
MAAIPPPNLEHRPPSGVVRHENVGLVEEVLTVDQPAAKHRGIT